MFKSIAAIFKGNYRIETAFQLAQESFEMYPKQLVQQMPTDMAREWRQNFRLLADSMSLNDHESAAMMIIGFVGLIEDPNHKARIESTLLDWYRSKLVRADVYFHFIEEKDKKADFL